jgi:hypothetical protein
MDQPSVSVIFHGASDARRALAKEVAAGAEEEGAVVRARRVADHEVSGDGETAALAMPDDVRWVGRGDLRLAEPVRQRGVPAAVLCGDAGGHGG